MKETMKEVLLCALLRIGAPSTASELCDTAIQLMQNEGWPRRSWAELNAKSASRHLQGMRDAGTLVSITQKDNGRDVPHYWLPKNGAPCDPKYPMPPPPDPEGEDHPLHGKTKRQQFVIFDMHDALLHTLLRQRTERQEQLDRTNAMVERHARELAELTARNRRDMLAAGLEVS